MTCVRQTLFLLVQLNLLIDKTNAIGCTAIQFKEFADSSIKSGDFKDTQYRFIISEQFPNDDILPDGTEIRIECAQGYKFAYIWVSPKLQCDNGEVSQIKISSDNHCIANDECSTKLFGQNWFRDGYIPKNDKLIISNMNSYLDLKCDTFYRPKLSGTAPKAICELKKGTDKAMWSPVDTKDWKLVKKCYSVTNEKPTLPSQGCGALSRGKCRLREFSKFCAYDTLKHKLIRASDDAIRTCNDMCRPWMCYSMFIPLQHADCQRQKDKNSCVDKQSPMLHYWCEWKSGQCTLKMGGNVITIKLDTCDGMTEFCWKSRTEKEWKKLSESFEGRLASPESETQSIGVKFGYNPMVVAFRHVVDRKDLTLLKGNLFTKVQLRDSKGEITEETQAQVKVDPPTMKSSWGLLSKMKAKAVQRLYSDPPPIPVRYRPPSPPFTYFSVQLNSDFYDDSVFETDSEITLSADTYFERKALSGATCTGCKLDLFPGSPRGDVVGWLQSFKYSYKIERGDMPKLRIQKWTAVAGKTWRLRATLEPGPEQCGQRYGCFVKVIPEWDEVAGAIFKLTASVPILARLKGFTTDDITFFGKNPGDRKKVAASYKVRTKKADILSQYIGRFLRVEWDIDMGITKAIRQPSRDDGLQPLETLISEQSKIDWYSIGTVKTRVGRSKLVYLKAKKAMPAYATITPRYSCPVQMAASITFLKGQRRNFVTVKAMEPCECQIFLDIAGDAQSMVNNPPPILIKVYNPSAGLVRISPQKLPPVINGEWSEEFSVALTRPPYKDRLSAKPISNFFEFTPSALEWEKGVQILSVMKATAAIAKIGVLHGEQTMKLRPVVECGGGKPYEVKWGLSGATEEFYQPQSMFIDVLVGATDDFQCASKMAAIVTVNETFPTDMNTPPMTETETLDTGDTQWRFEYYLIGGACTICILVVTNQSRDEKFDRLLSTMTGNT